MNQSPKVYVCVKTFRDFLQPFEETMSIFTTEEAANRFNREFPQYSMDDPESFTMSIKTFDLDSNRWNIV